VACGALALATATSRAAAAQSAQEPNLVLSIQLGFTTGGDLWRIPNQEALVAGTNQRDTVSLERLLRTGVVAVLNGTYFRSPHLGYTLEAGFFGIASESRCAPVGTFKPQPDDINQQACTSVQGRHLPTNAVGFQAGLTYRFRSQAAVRPYVRAGAGVALLGRSFIETSGTVTTEQCAGTAPSCPWPFVDEAERDSDGSVRQTRRELAFVSTLAAGAMLQTAPAYRVRVEVRDLIIGLPVPSGPASVGGAVLIAPTQTVLKHIPTFSVGLDVVLERRRTRRY
jgi:hypothetical protein